MKTAHKPSGIIGNHKKKQEESIVLATKVFWGPMGCLGRCILGWFTSSGPLTVAMVQRQCAQCNNTLVGAV